MANYCATARSNYFAVTDEKSFRKWAETIDLSILEPDHRDQDDDGIRRLGITPRNHGDNGGWPSSRYNDETNECEDIDLPEQLSAHLADDEVAVLMEVGNEKLRYVNGTATAVNSKGETVYVNLESIYESARTLGANITSAEY
jgi:hypothetical protein